jgi:Ni,Fe-hydrogenase III large subunit/NADH:ubiquinone oxidoreductase subunit C
VSAYEWLPDFLDRLKADNVLLEDDSITSLAKTPLLILEAEDWGRAAAQAQKFGLRWIGGWADQVGEKIRVNTCLVYQNEMLALRARLSLDMPVLPSHTPYYPGADRMERHTQDMYGVLFSDHPDPRRWARHHAWGENEYPLRTDFPVAGTRPGPMPTDHNYRFLQAQGAGVYEIPVGPVHAGVIEPGHFRFLAVGEMVLNLEQRLGYVHKGIEKISVGRDAAGVARLAARVSGDSTVSHGWAACMAMEQAAAVQVPDRASYLRAIMAERERIANHLGDIGAICNDVAFAFAQYQFSRLREAWQRISQQVFGHRFMMDCIVPGGVACDADSAGLELLRSGLEPLRRELQELMPILDDNSSLEDRIMTTGFLSAEIASKFGSTGYVGKASGQDIDARRDMRYAPYDRLDIKVPVLQDGDVEARMHIRSEEILASLDLLEQLLRDIPEGEICSDWRVPAPDAEGIAVVDGWRGEIMTYVRFGTNGKVARFFPRDPSWFTWPALEQLIHGNIVPDFPVCNKSVNGSYSGHDL